MTGLWIALRGAGCLLVLGAGSTLRAQLQQPPAMPSLARPGVNGTDPHNEDRVPPEVRERMEKARQDERMKRIQVDTDRLLALATALKTDVDKTDKYTLSLDVVRRADEIDKLARSIRDREKQ